MYFYLSVISYLVYSFLVSKLFITSLISSLRTADYLVSLLKVIIIGFLFYEIIIEWVVYLKPKQTVLKEKAFSTYDLKVFLSVFLGALSSYLLNHNFALGAVVASSLVGIVGGLLIKKYAVPIYCGTFAGMVSIILVSDLISVLMVGTFTGILYVVGSDTFKGFGGKLGATAYFGTLLASIFSDTFNNTMTGSSISIQYAVFIVFIIGALGTYLINSQYDIGVVPASSLLGLIGGLVLPNMLADGTALAVALFCGTFIGMSTTTKLTTRVSVLIASIIGAIIYLYTSPYFAGLGGKLGLIAFGSSIATAGIYNLRSNLQKREKINSR